MYYTAFRNLAALERVDSERAAEDSPGTPAAEHPCLSLAFRIRVPDVGTKVLHVLVIKAQTGVGHLDK